MASWGMSSAFKSTVVTSRVARMVGFPPNTSPVANSSLRPGLPVARCEHRCRNGIAIVAQELRSRDKADLRFREFRLESFQHRNHVRRNSVVVSQQIFGLICERPNHGDFELVLVSEEACRRS